jgi:hypothetical protein
MRKALREALGILMGTTTLLIIAVICLMSFSAMTGLIGGYFFFAGKFAGGGSIVDDLVTAVSESPVALLDAPHEELATQAQDPASAPTLAPEAPSSSAETTKPTSRPSQGDLSLDDFFTDFSVDAVNMSGDLPQISEAAANRQGTGDLEPPSRRPQTEPVDASQVLDEALPEGAG